jgi:hypothetical protein
MWIELILTGFLIVKVFNSVLKVIKLAYMIDEEDEPLDPYIQSMMYF